MLKKFISGLFSNRELGDLADSLVASMVRRLPSDVASGSDPAVERQIGVLLSALASRALRHRDEHGWGLLGKGILGRLLRRKLKDAGYESGFAEKAARRITAA